MSGALYKGFTCSHLELSFGVRFDAESVTVPYYDAEGRVYREKEFSPGGRPRRWVGDNKPQTLYGRETLSLGGTTAFLTEGESCAWALRAEFPSVPVLAVPGASAWRSEWAIELADFPVLYLSFDGDTAGRELLDAVWPSLPWGRRVKLPEGRDTRDVLQLYGGGEEYERLLDDADYTHACLLHILETPARLGGASVAA